MSVVMRSAVLGLALAAIAVPPAYAEDMIGVDWSGGEIKQFVDQRKAEAARGAAPQLPSGLDKLKLPVLAFQGAPDLVQSSFPGLGPQPMGERAVHTDDANPVWYQIVDTYGDISVSVAADLRVQHKFDANFPVYGAPAAAPTPGAAPSAAPAPGAAAPSDVSVFDSTQEENMEGTIAEYTITRFGVPYTITIECTAATKARCADVNQVAKDSELLKIIAATPPG